MDPGTRVLVVTYSRWGENKYPATVIALIPAGVAIEEVLPENLAYPRGAASRARRDRILVVTDKNETKTPLPSHLRRL